MAIISSFNAAKPMPGSIYKRLFIVLCFLVLITRVTIWFVLSNDEQRFKDEDTANYTLPAKALLEKQQFLLHPSNTRLHNTFRTPGYPFWIALNYAVFGERSNPLVIGNIIFFIVTLIILFKLTEDLFDQQTAFIATVIYSFDPPSFVSTFKILTETLTTFFTLLFLYYFVFYLKNNNRGLKIFYAGLFLTIATFIRPTTYYLPPVLIIFLAVFYFKTKENGRNIIIDMAILVLPFILLTGVWQIRNQNVANTYQFVTQTGSALLTGKGAHIISLKEKISSQAAEKKVIEDMMANTKIPVDSTQQEIDQMKRKAAIRIILESPWLSIKSHFMGLLSFFLEPGTTSAFFRLFDPNWKIMDFNLAEMGSYFNSILHKHKTFALLLAMGWVYLGFLYFLITYSLIYFERKSDSLRTIWGHTFIVLFILYIANVYAMGSNSARYRTVIMPLICMYAAAGLVKFLNNRKKVSP